MAKVQLVVVVALLIALGSALSLTESQLECTPREVEPGANITCYIYARNDMLEPTAKFDETSFTVKLLAKVADAKARVSPIQRTVDPNVAKFTVSSDQGSSILINVEVTETGMRIKNSGFLGTVLTYPPLRLGALSCNASTLQLRENAVCSVEAFGANDVPAVVRANDVYFSEDHTEGSFRFLGGMKNIEFSYTAPNFRSVIFNDFVLRVTLSSGETTGTAVTKSATLPLIVPPLQATEQSVLKCAGNAAELCFVNAADSIGPVKFNASQFIVRVEEFNTQEELWNDITETMNVFWTPVANNQGSKTLKIEPKIDNKVFKARLSVECNGCNKNKQLPIIGSPMMFRVGTPPTAQFVSLRRCDMVFMTPENTTTCVLAFASTVTPDPSYVTVSASSGGKVSTLSLVNTSTTKGLSFRFTPPSVRSRTTMFLTVRVGNQEVTQSPWKVVVYPRKTGGTIEIEEGNTRPPKIFLGVVFFGGILAVGAVLFCQRQQRIARIRARNAKKWAEAEMSDRSSMAKSMEINDNDEREQTPMPEMSLGDPATPQIESSGTNKPAAREVEK